MGASSLIPLHFNFEALEAQNIEEPTQVSMEVAPTWLLLGLVSGSLGPCCLLTGW